MAMTLKCWFLFFIVVSSCFDFSCLEGMATPSDIVMSVNNKLFSSNSTNNVYKFSEREGCSVSCSAGAGAGARLRLTYSFRGGQVSTDLLGGAVRLYLQLRASRGGVLACSRAGGGAGGRPAAGAGGNTTVLLELDEVERETLYFKVNGLRLPAPAPAPAQYRYRAGESPVLTLHKPARGGGASLAANCTVTRHDGFDIALMKLDFNGFSGLVRKFYTLSARDSGMSVACEAGRGRGEPRRVRLLLVHHAPDYSPYISGLSSARVLLEYSTSSSHVVWYSAGGDTLNLTCVSPVATLGTSFQFQRSEVDTPPEAYAAGPRAFRLQPDTDEAVITCQLDSSPADKKTYLYLKREKTDVDDLDSGSLFVRIRREELDAAMIKTVWVSALVAALAALVAAAACAARRCTKRMLLKQGLSNVEFKNQQDIVNAELTLTENLNVSLVPKTERTETEPTYAELLHFTRDTTELNKQPLNKTIYASIQHTEPTNTTVQSSKNVSIQSPDLTYANLNLIAFQTHVLKTEDNAEVKNETSDIGTKYDKKEEGETRHKYANLTNNATETPVYSNFVLQNTYVNRLDEGKNNGYENTAVKDVIEPAYCEVINMKSKN